MYTPSLQYAKIVDLLYLGRPWGYPIIASSPFHFDLVKSLFARPQDDTVFIVDIVIRDQLIEGLHPGSIHICAALPDQPSGGPP